MLSPVSPAVVEGERMAAVCPGTEECPPAWEGEGDMANRGIMQGCSEQCAGFIIYARMHSANTLLCV